MIIPVFKQKISKKAFEILCFRYFPTYNTMGIPL